MKNLSRVVKFEGYSERAYKGSIYQKEHSPDLWNYEKVIKAKDSIQKRTNHKVTGSFDKQLDRYIKKCPQRKKKIISIYQQRGRKFITGKIRHNENSI